LLGFSSRYQSAATQNFIMLRYFDNSTSEVLQECLVEVMCSMGMLYKLVTCFLMLWS